MGFENLKSTGIKYVLTKLKDYFLMIKDAVKSVNGNEPDEDGDITITSVPYASNLESESSHRSYDVFLQRTTGGDSSVSNGDAWLMDIKGNNVHEDYVAESIEMTVTTLGEDPITATIDRDTFVSYVATSGTITLVYSTDWSADPTLYGITVTGTPVAGDTIVIDYTKEVRGTITVANPQSFVSTGWNLYDHSNGYAKVVKYSHGYRIDGTYTSIKFATTPTGTQSDVVVNSGNFDIPSDGYIIVTGGNSSSTAIYPVWEDWDEGYTGDFEAYNASTVDLSTIMSTYFPYGLLKAGSVVDELNLNLGQAISRVERMNYTAENLATAKASGREFEYDENYIFLARASAATTSVTVSGAMAVNDHGIEYFTGSGAEVDTEVLYGNNLKNKLERDVLTISAQELTSAQKSQILSNIGIDKFAKVNTFSNISSLDGLKSALDAANATLTDCQVYTFRFLPTEAFDKFHSTSAYYGMIYRYDSSNYNCIIISGYQKQIIIVARYTNGWRISEANDPVNSIETRSVSVPLPATFAANSTYNTNLKTIIDADLPTGKKCIGIVGYDSAGGMIVFSQLRYANNSYSFQCVNVSSSAYTNKTASVTYLCINS